MDDQVNHVHASQGDQNANGNNADDAQRAADGRGESPDSPAAQTSKAKQQARIADLVARGELPVPVHLPHQQLHSLVQDVRKLRRQRLLAYIARVIAVDIHQSRNARKDEADVEKKI